MVYNIEKTSNKKYLFLKNKFGCISIVEFVIARHPTWESIIDTVTMQTLL